MKQEWLEGHRARKRFGQNFLHDQHWIGRIVRSIDAKPEDAIIEIGPGQAALTREIIACAGHETAVEIDRDLAAFLRTQFAPEALTLIEADALTLDWATVLEGKRLRIIGNLPYNISSPLLFALMKGAHRVIDQHFMLQKEVVDRMTADVVELTAALRAERELRRSLALFVDASWRPGIYMDGVRVHLATIACGICF